MTSTAQHSSTGQAMLLFQVIASPEHHKARKLKLQFKGQQIFKMENPDFQGHANLESVNTLHDSGVKTQWFSQQGHRRGGRRCDPPSCRAVKPEGLIDL